MPDWTRSMKQTYEFCEVDPATWKNRRLIQNVKSCTLDLDSESNTLGSASLDVTDSFRECYMRPYLVTEQDGHIEKFPLGTYLVQTPAISYNGKVQSISMDAYTPLLELNEKQPPIGYTIMKNSEIVSLAKNLCESNLRAPVLKAYSSEFIEYNFVASTDDTWLTYLTDFLANAKMKFGLDELGQVYFERIQDTASLQPVWTYTDDNSSILYPEITVDRDIYGIPNVVEVIYSTSAGYMMARAENYDPNSPVSTYNREREIVYRVVDPNVLANPTQAYLNEYAKQLLRDLSALEYTVTYTHGFCPVRLGDCVRLNYIAAGLDDVKAKVIRQNIKCQTGCPVTETAVFTKNLWG